jgi:hypothetical protein
MFNSVTGYGPGRDVIYNAQGFSTCPSDFTESTQLSVTPREGLVA